MIEDYEQLAREAFVEEAAQMLQQFQHSTLQLCTVAHEPTALREAADAAFRAAHTLKGSAGIFGLTDLVELTHQTESLLAAVREGVLQPSTDTESLLLAAHDAIAALCANPWCAEGTPTAPSEGPPAHTLKALQDRLAAAALAGTPQPAPQPASQPAPPPAPRQTAASADPAGPGLGPTPSPANAQPAQPQAAAARPAADSGPKLRVGAAEVDGLIESLSEAASTMAATRLQALLTGRAALLDSAMRSQATINQARQQALGLRMVPLTEVFSRFPRLVRDLALSLGKDVQLLTDGGDAEIDRALVEAVADPLTHLVRNSLDHGIESPAERLQAGKPAQGLLRIAARREAGQVLIEVQDDGRGLNRDRIRTRALQRGLLAEGEACTDADLLRLICAPGFSTAASVTNISGRGVGMDVVKRNIEALQGSLHLRTREGQGTRMQLRVPMTLALLDAFVVRVGTGRYLLPIDSVVECAELPRTRNQVGNAAALHNAPVNGRFMPCLDLRTLFSTGAALASGRNRPSRLVVQAGDTALGLVVDQVLGKQQVVIRSLGPLLAELRAFNGACVLDDGAVGHILDPQGLQELLGTQSNATKPTSPSSAYNPISPAPQTNSTSFRMSHDFAQ